MPEAARPAPQPRPRFRLRPRLRPPARRAAAALAAVPAVAFVGLAGACAGTDPPPVGDDGVARSTTAIAGAPVLGADEDGSAAPGGQAPPPSACGPTAPLDPGADPATDPRRIAVVGSAALDTLCALGLQDRVVAVAPPPGQAPLRYLGAWTLRAPAAGTAVDPDLPALRSAAPDLLFVDDDPTAAGPVRGLGPVGDRTVDVPVSGPWEESVTTVAAAVGRSGAADDLLAGFENRAHGLSVRAATGQTQASVARFTADGTCVLGSSAFAAQVLHTAEVARPPGQHFDAPECKPVSEGDLAALEGDVLYIAFAGEDVGDVSQSVARIDAADGSGDTGGGTDPAVEHGVSVMQSSAWERLGVTRDSVFVVDDGAWIRGRGLVAAGDIVDDLLESLG